MTFDFSEMPCHISDGPQTPDEMHEAPEQDEDEAYENYRQQKIDDRECMAPFCANKHTEDSIHCEEHQ